MKYFLIITLLMSWTLVASAEETYEEPAAEEIYDERDYQDPRPLPEQDGYQAPIENAPRSVEEGIERREEDAFTSESMEEHGIEPENEVNFGDPVDEPSSGSLENYDYDGEPEELYDNE